MDKVVSTKLKLGIILIPIVFSWFTLKKGYSPLARVVSFSWLALTLVVVMSGNEQTGVLIGVIALGAFTYAIISLFIFVFNKVTQRKEKMLSIINDDEQWAEYCIRKNLTPSAQKFVLKTYGIEKEPVELPTADIKVKVSVSSTSTSEHEREWKSYDSVDTWKQDCKVLWTGTTKDIEFSYSSSCSRPKERRTLTPQEFGIDGNGSGYIKGICHKSNEQRTFKLHNFETKIKVGSQRFDPDEWVEKYLHLDTYDLYQKYGASI
ncbi:WYL domain-containing protein [Vibrio ostreae]|uniref:WYL domain-containing protein n=1 Tax=Vibrio ostreae TaxID=2841925 RepID=A0A975UDT0_9VIBR|nr:WYL domain-containing protein [Vibrio ostreae]QXO19236.1 WYL domain-containing protein [Vibrio ostreae]